MSKPRGGEKKVGRGMHGEGSEREGQHERAFIRELWNSTLARLIISTDLHSHNTRLQMRAATCIIVYLLKIGSLYVGQCGL